MTFLDGFEFGLGFISAGLVLGILVMIVSIIGFCLWALRDWIRGK